MDNNKGDSTGKTRLTTTVRAVSTIIVFAIPLVVFTATVIGCGVRELCKIMRR